MTLSQTRHPAPPAMASGLTWSHTGLSCCGEMRFRGIAGGSACAMRRETLAQCARSLGVAGPYPFGVEYWLW